MHKLSAIQKQMNEICKGTETNWKVENGEVIVFSPMASNRCTAHDLLSRKYPIQTFKMMVKQNRAETKEARIALAENRQMKFARREVFLFV